MAIKSREGDLVVDSNKASRVPLMDSQWSSSQGRVVKDFNLTVKTVHVAVDNGFLGGKLS